MKYDIAIVGAGPAGIFAAYEIINKLMLNTDRKLKVIMFESGNDINKRNCPILENKVKTCINCSSCSIMRGFGGAGAFSDGKYNLTTEFGGILNDYISDKEVMDLIYYVDEINYKNGAPEDLYYTDSSIKQEALKHNLHLLQSSVRHLGTENNLKILKKISDFLSQHIIMKFNTKVLKVIKHERNNEFILDVVGPDHTVNEIKSDYLIVAPGRAGAEWFSEQCNQLDLPLINNQVDVGVRVELPFEIYKDITDKVYEAKLKYRTKQYGDIVRTFCMNPKGYVVTENTDGIVTVNGHSYEDPNLASKNTNFALLVSNHFTEPFKEPHQYGKRIASFSNMLGGGVLVQRFGDLIKGRRTTEHRLVQCFTKPTLKATPGDLSLVLPKRHLDNIIEMIYALDKLAPGTANDDTLLYGVEVKFYSSRLKLTSELETEISNLYCCGDGAGITRSLSQAAASGIHVARAIEKRIKEL